MDRFLSLDYWFYVFICLHICGAFIWGLFGVLMIFEKLPDKKDSDKKDIDNN